MGHKSLCLSLSLDWPFHWEPHRLCGDGYTGRIKRERGLCCTQHHLTLCLQGGVWAQPPLHCPYLCSWLWLLQKHFPRGWYSLVAFGNSCHFKICFLVHKTVVHETGNIWLFIMFCSLSAEGSAAWLSSMWHSCTVVIIMDCHTYYKYQQTPLFIMCQERFPFRAQVVKSVKWSGLSTDLLFHLLIFMKADEECVWKENKWKYEKARNRK